MSAKVGFVDFVFERIRAGAGFDMEITFLSVVLADFAIKILLGALSGLTVRL
jgi:hypothetical protein